MEAQRLLKSNLEELKPRERILRTALKLFNEIGPNRTGTDLIIEESKVAKMTFFRQFKTKDHLIAEVLKIQDSDWFSLLRHHSSSSEKSDLEKALGLFDALKEWYERPQFNGCPFIRGIYDFSDKEVDSDIKIVIETHFQKLEELVSELLNPLHLREQKKVVIQFITLIAGSILVAQVAKSSSIALTNRDQAKALLLTYSRKRPS